MTRSTTAVGIGVDSPMARTAQGKFCLPESLVKGRVLEAVEELWGLGLFQFEPDDLFGEQSDKGDWSAKRARLRFEEFTNDAGPGGRRYRIALDGDLRSVKKGAMQVLESPYGAGTEAVFRGGARLVAESETEANEIRTALQRAFRLVTSFGGERTIGFGRVKAVEFGKLAAVEGNAVTASGDRFALSLEPLAPFCLAQRRADDNLFESETNIPGGVIRACVATAWMEHLGKKGVVKIEPDSDPKRKELCEQFSQIRFLHAFPTRKGSGVRAATAPLSLIQCPGNNAWFGDVLLQEKAVVLHAGERGEKRIAPAFAIDWKSDNGVSEAFGQESPRRHLRVRTALSAQTRAAKKEQLFAMETVVPDGFEWAFQVDLRGVLKDREKVAAQLLEVLSMPIGSMGKTDAPAVIRAGNEWATPELAKEQSPGTGLYAITLQTPGLLCDPLTLKEASGDGSLASAYKAYFQKASGEALELQRFFASQTLAGGRYLHQHFRRGKGYRPWLLTDAGSVFLLKTLNDEADAVIDNWRQYGMPLPEWSGYDFGRSWGDCPYHPVNGFGEILVNISVHVRNGLKEGEYDAI